MSSQASSAGHGEAIVRRKIIETGEVDVMISIRPNFFYTRTVPCELWHFDRSKPKERRDQVLMLDARNIYRKVTRKIYDFSPEQLANLTAIVWLYRGQSDRFLGLVQSYLDRTLSEAALIAGQATALQAAYKAVVDATAAFLKFLLPSPGTLGEGPGVRALCELVSERDTTATTCFASLHDWSGRISKNWKKPCEQKLSAQKKRLTELEPLAHACRDLVKDVDLVCKLAGRVIDTAEKDFAAREHDDWGNRAISKLAKELDERRKDLVEQLKRTAYFERQAHWLLSRFPDGKFAAVAGLCRAVTLKDIEAADWSLTPGRYVGVAPAEVDEDFDFEQLLKDIHIELADLNEEAVSLSAKIQENFGGLGI